jgi:hypothetical protein
LTYIATLLPFQVAHVLALSATPNGLRYLRVGGRGFCLGAEKNRSQKNAPKCRRIPHVRCTRCWAAAFNQLERFFLLLIFTFISARFSFPLTISSINSLLYQSLFDSKYLHNTGLLAKESIANVFHHS